MNIIWKILLLLLIKITVRKIKKENKNKKQCNNNNNDNDNKSNNTNNILTIGDQILYHDPTREIGSYGTKEMATIIDLRKGPTMKMIFSIHCVSKKIINIHGNSNIQQKRPPPTTTINSND